MSSALTCVVYGTETGNTEEAARRITKHLENLGLGVDLHDIDSIDLHQLMPYEFLILGVPTWDYGGIQSDWEELEAALADLDLTGKVVALYGLGDQSNYAEFFVDAMGWLHEMLAESNATFVGAWPTLGYDFEASRAASDDKTYFVGLALDEDNQADLTEDRIEQWLDQVLEEYVALIS
ncbi:MAG: flavodoxin [Actinomycetota bacterium]